MFYALLKQFTNIIVILTNNDILLLYRITSVKPNNSQIPTIQFVTFMESQNPQILLVDDSRAITENLTPFLERSGFTVSVAADGEAALDKIAKLPPDLIVLDILMPKLDGREVLRRLREMDNWTPVILLTDVGEAYERTMALEEGADDYMNKPFEPPELVARMKAVLRRASMGQPSLTSQTRLVCEELAIDRQTRRAYLNDVEIDLKPKSYALLEYLMIHPNEFFTRDQLLNALWGTDAYIDRVIDRHISTLRRALNEDASNPYYIETVPGQGYRFIGKVKSGA